MRLLLTSDLHLTPRPEHAYRLEYLEWIARTVTEEHVHAVVIAGDLVDAKDRHPAWFVNRIVDLLVTIVDQLYTEYDDGRLHLLFGNHDGPSKDEPFWNFLRHIPHIHYHTKLTFDHNPRVDATLIFAPFGKEHELIERLKGALSSHMHVAFLHASADNALVENGTRIANEKLPSVFIPSMHRDKVRVFSGDIHVPQQLGDITYIGSPYHTRFGDQFQPRTLIYDTAKDQLETLLYEDAPQLLTMRVEVPNQEQVYHFIEKNVRGRDQVKLIGSADHTLLPADWQAFTKFVAHALDECGAVLKSAKLEVLRVDAESVRAPSARRGDGAIVRTYAHQQGFSEETTQEGLAIVEPRAKGNS